MWQKGGGEALDPEYFFNLYNRDGSKHTLFVRQARQLYQLIPDPQGHGRDYDFVESSLIYVNRVEQAIRLSVLVAPAIPPSSEDEEEKVKVGYSNKSN